jgi:hypothetical protein
VKANGLGKLVPSQMLVGGCVASESKWLKFSSEWRRALDDEGVSVFHAKDFYHFRRQFEWYTKDGEKDLARHESLRDRLADIITSNVDEAIAFASEVSLKNGKVKLSYTDGALRALHDCTKSMMRANERIHVIFARHPELSPWSIIRYFEKLDWDRRLAGCGVFEPDEVIPLQASDFVMHCVNKSWGSGVRTKSEERLAERFRKRDKSFSVQLGSTWDPQVALGEPLS